MAQHHIPARRAVVFWNDDPEPRNRLRPGGAEVLVRALDDVGGDNDPKQLSCSLGANSQGWMDGTDPMGTPEGVFARVWLYRDATPAAMRAALEQFAAIDECEWARNMLATFDFLDGRE